MNNVFFKAALLLVACCGQAFADTPQELAEATIVVFNETDPDSEPLARFYAEKRGIAADHVIGLHTVPTEDISRADYESQIAEPLRQMFTGKKWWKLREGDSPQGRAEQNSIRFIALIRGMPLRIQQAPGWPGDVPNGPPPVSEHNVASVDSELTVLGVYSKSLLGILKNPYFRSFTRIRDARSPAIMLVARLDAPTPDLVRRMITDSLATEKEGLKGFACIDARGIKEGAYAEGDAWMTAAAIEARRRGMPVLMDNGDGLFPTGYPLRRAALYLGWYAEHVSGPFTRPDFRFARGAVAVHIHSYSAATLRDPKRHWCAPLIAAGAAATLGSVSEPYLTLTPHLDIFLERLQAGFTFAESGWASQLGLSWMTTLVGDPLYRPFPSDLHAGTRPPASDEWTAYSAGAEVWMKDRTAGAKALRDSAKRLRSGMIQEGLGLLWLSGNNSAAAITAFAEARRLYKEPEDISRAAIHEIIQLQGMKRIPDALALARKQIAAAPQAPVADVFRMFEAQMAPPPPPPPTGR